jgi:hypothetical protein
VVWNGGALEPHALVATAVNAIAATTSSEGREGTPAAY